MRVGFAFNVKRKLPADADFDSPQVIEKIKTTLEELGHQVVMIEADLDAFAKLRNEKSNIDIVFTIAEGLNGDARESQIPLFCEMLGIPYTHSTPTTHAIKLDKTFAKQIVQSTGVFVPYSRRIRRESDLNYDWQFPLIVKPAKEGSSLGILDKNLVKTHGQLKAQAREISEGFTKEVLAEAYIDGREFTVALLGNTNPQILPIIEQRFDFLPPGYNKIASYELKWIFEDRLEDPSQAFTCPAVVNDNLKKKIEAASLAIYQVLDVHECARIDFRQDANGDLYFLEINTLPGLNPDPKAPSYYVYAAWKAGMSYKELIGEILRLACARWNIV